MVENFLLPSPLAIKLVPSASCLRVCEGRRLGTSLISYVHRFKSAETVMMTATQIFFPYAVSTSFSGQHIF